MATLAAVAAHARVGIGTVSRVLNDSPQVSPEMRQRVLRSMDAVGYAKRRRRPEPLRRSSFVGALVVSFDEASVYQRLLGLIARLQPHGHEVVVYDVTSPAQAVQRLAELPAAPLAGLVVVSLPLSDDEAAALARAPFPTVLVDTEAPGLPSLGIDDRRGGAIATQHLVDLGHTRIGFVGQPPSNPFGSVASVRREEGYRDTLRRAGIEPVDQLVRHGAHQRSAAKQHALDLLTLDDPPTAIVAASDLQALGVLEAAHALGRRVPDELSVVGYDDLELASVLQLTTVRQPLEGSGARAADLVLEALAEGNARPADVHEELQIELVVRATSGPRR